MRGALLRAVLKARMMGARHPASAYGLLSTYRDRRRLRMLSAFQSLRWAFAEASAVPDREPAHMREAGAHRDLGDALLRPGVLQRPPSLEVASAAGIAHGRDALEVLEVLEQGALGDARGCDEVDDPEACVQMGVDVVDGQPHVAWGYRSGRPRWLLAAACRG